MMLKRSAVLMLLTAMIATVALEIPAFAQRPTRSPAARRRSSSALGSPEVHEDYRVTFRLRAPTAARVAVTGQWTGEPATMTKDDEGLWSVTVGPVEPGVWEYSFRVDGLQMIDPGNPAIKPMRQPRTSILHLPGRPPRLHDYQRVAHGVVHHHSYFSQSLGRMRDMAVYTPPGYEKQADARFPTLYLQHGSGDNQATWVVHGKAHWILDNLIARDRAIPMVVVMMDGHAAAGPRQSGDNTTAFERDLLRDVMPLVEANYRVQTNPTGRAIAGLSMGGGQSLTIGLNHTDRFAWVAGFSSSAPSEERIAAALKNPTATNQRLKLLWIACGRDDFLLQRNKDLIATLKDEGIRHEWHLTDGNHSWPVWRIYLAELAPKLFR